jgi:hypothetical protein
MPQAQHQNQHPQLQQQPTPPQQRQHQQHQQQKQPQQKQPQPQHKQPQQQPTPPQLAPPQLAPPQPTPPPHQQQHLGPSGIPLHTGYSVKSPASGSLGGHSVASSSGGSIIADKPMSDMLSGTPGPLRDHKLDERFEYVLYCLRTAGCESFDGLVTAYYSSNFDEASTLAMEQRLSRNRGLPNVVAELFRSAGSWSEWERRGFHEELLKTTEMMLIAESKNVPVGPLSMALQNGEDAAQAITAMKTEIQNEVSLPAQLAASRLSTAHLNPSCPKASSPRM